METGKEIPLKRQLECLKPDDKGTPEEFNAYNMALSALEQGDAKTVLDYIKDTRAKLGFEKKQTQ